jgi:hypothetical protein
MSSFSFSFTYSLFSLFPLFPFPFNSFMTCVLNLPLCAGVFGHARACAATTHNYRYLVEKVETLSTSLTDAQISQMKLEVGIYDPPVIPMPTRLPFLWL